MLKARYEKGSCQGKRNDILQEIARLEGKESVLTSGHGDQKLTTRDQIGAEYELSGSSVGRLLKLNDLIGPFKDMVDRGALYTKVALQLAFLPETEQELVYADCPFKVKVTATDLNIRKGAGTNYAKTGKYTGAGVFTIVEVKEGKGSAAGWGKLKSGAGWIALSYCTRA